MSSIKQYRSFELAEFQLYLTTLDKDQRVPFIVTLPPSLRLGDSDIGVNTYRANGVVSGEFEFTKPGVVTYTRGRGQSPQDSRVANAGEWLVKSTEDDSTLVCVLAKNPKERFYNYALHPLAPGESVVFDDSDLQRNVFLVQGSVQTEGRTFSDVQHLRLSQPKDYTFTNATEDPAYIVFVKEISYDDAAALAEVLYPDRDVEFGFITDHVPA